MSSAKNSVGQFYSLKDRDHCVVVGETKIGTFFRTVRQLNQSEGSKDLG